MKKYLSLASIFGAIAFIGVSCFAQAEQPAAPAPGAAMESAAPADAAKNYAKDRAECDALASAPSTEGAATSEADKEAVLKKCLAAKGHSLDEITKEEAAKSAAPAPSEAPAAPAAQ